MHPKHPELDSKAKVSKKFKLGKLISRVINVTFRRKDANGSAQPSDTDDEDDGEEQLNAFELSNQIAKEILPRNPVSTTWQSPTTSDISEALQVDQLQPSFEELLALNTEVCAKCGKEVSDDCYLFTCVAAGENSY